MIVQSPSMRREWIEIVQCVHMQPVYGSPSMRREWIEIAMLADETYTAESPSMRREWIEMSHKLIQNSRNPSSPSMRREWIEISAMHRTRCRFCVSLHAEGVD